MKVQMRKELTKLAIVACYLRRGNKGVGQGHRYRKRSERDLMFL